MLFETLQPEHMAHRQSVGVRFPTFHTSWHAQKLVTLGINQTCSWRQLAQPPTRTPSLGHQILAHEVGSLVPEHPPTALSHPYPLGLTFQLKEK